MVSKVNGVWNPLIVGACITAVVTVAGTFYAVLNPRSDGSRSSVQSTAIATATNPHCRTIVNDPQPPLNVRSEPAELTNNVVGQVKNGEMLTVRGGNEAWFEVSSPVQGWVDQALTKTVCGSAEQINEERSKAAQIAAKPIEDQGDRILASAIAIYQAGDLPGAIALAKTIPSSSSAYPKAQARLKTMPSDWKHAQSLYAKAEKALKQSQWEIVLKIVDNFPDIRFWRERLAPLVKEAIQLRHAMQSPSKSE
ncbi:MAG: SH3 domain-containing protein [Leptolyngbyaceae cyanobacterium CSU_1_3]|nr:SH3 domain-containing protein [Leptolyngbyaceae cyanobacterium CSU_1_3]